MNRRITGDALSRQTGKDAPEREMPEYDTDHETDYDMNHDTGREAGQETGHSAATQGSPVHDVSSQNTAVQDTPAHHMSDQYVTAHGVVTQGQASRNVDAASGDFALASYDFHLPEGQIAQHPAPQRGTSRLLVVHKASDPLRLEEKIFTDILDVLPKNCLLVANNSRVVPARLMGKRPSGGKVEFLLLSPLPLLAPRPLSFAEKTRFSLSLSPSSPTSSLSPDGVTTSFIESKTDAMDSPSRGSHAAEHTIGEALSRPEKSFEGSVCLWQCAEAEGLLRSSKQVKTGELLRFSADLHIELIERHDFGRSRVRLIWRGDLHALLDREGSLPLPPYIKRTRAEDGSVREASGGWGSDGERYQTVYSKESKAGSVAAPTAGLHFTPELRERIVASGRQWVEATLYVGYGTFSPVREKDIREHVMHAEYVELSEEAAVAINQAKREGRPVIPIGTTSVRILEGVYRALHGRGEKSEKLPVGQELSAYAGWVNLFLYPGEPFYMVDGLVTNFHLPGSSLLMLVSAFAGRKAILEAYDYAVEHGFRFFSYGDSMFIY